MEEKNKNELENIVRRDDSDDDFNPPENSVEVSKVDYYKLIGRKLKNREVKFKKSFWYSEPLFDNPLNYIRGSLKYEEMEASVDQDLSRYIQLKVNYFEVLGEDVSETDLQQLKLYWLDDKIQSFNNEISNTNDLEERLKLEKLREYLEGLKNPAKPDGEKQLPEITFANLFILPDAMQAALTLAQKAGLINRENAYCMGGNGKYAIAVFYQFLKEKKLVVGSKYTGQKACETIAAHFGTRIGRNLWNEKNINHHVESREAAFLEILNNAFGNRE